IHARFFTTRAVCCRNVQPLRRDKQPVEPRELNTFGAHDAAQLKPPGRADLVEMVGKSERCDLHALITCGLDGTTLRCELPLFKHFVTDGILEVQLRRVELGCPPPGSQGGTHRPGSREQEPSSIHESPHSEDLS